GRGRDAQARPGARGRPARAGERRGDGRRVRAQPGEEDHHRRRPRREGANPGDDRRSAAEGGPEDPRRRRRARDRHLPRAPSAERRAQDRGGMIGKLKGVLDSYGEDFIVVDVQGVGYLVHCSARPLQALPGEGEPVTLAIETHVREDQIRLFGFQSDLEREWFRLLQTVQGVGTKVALSILSTLKPADLASAIALRDKAMITRSPGVGPKVAERVVT